jgi:FHA domain-containing protein
MTSLFPHSEQPTGTSESAAKPVCPNCEHPHRLGELICPLCGMLLARGGRTHQIEITELPARRKTRHGEAYADNPKSIYFEIDGLHVSMPLKQTIILGRQSDSPDDPQPDLDLGPYNAHERGVSRRHVLIRYQGLMTYVTDLGSSNGTWLNGVRLAQNRERLLRNGDELQLGRLRLNIRF